MLAFDGDCGFCTTSARFLSRTVSGGGYLVAPWQRLDLAALGLSADQCAEAVQWVDRSGRVRSAEHAIAAALRHGRPVWRPVGALIELPGIALVAGEVYRWVSRHRHALPGGTPACRVRPAANG